MPIKRCAWDFPGSVTAEKRQCQDAVPTVEGLTAVSDSEELLKAGMSLQLVSLLSLLSHSLHFPSSLHLGSGQSSGSQSHRPCLSFIENGGQQDLDARPFRPCGNDISSISCCRRCMGSPCRKPLYSSTTILRFDRFLRPRPHVELAMLILDQNLLLDTVMDYVSNIWEQWNGEAKRDQQESQHVLAFAEAYAVARLRQQSPHSEH